FADTNNAPDAPDATNEAELLAEQAARIAELEDQNLRMVAEVENLRRRFERERADLARYAVMPLAKEILPGIDNLERAIMAGNTPQSQDAQAFENFATGVKMTLDMLMENMTRCHIERVGAIGEVFDPNLHQVISEAPADEAHAAGTIAQIMQYGYRLHDRLIRPAMVIIAK
ncbi:MAG: nucleotide exchange factor GrpE, partial [Pseudomonadota bacterium]